MHFTGGLASIPASYFTQHWGRKGCAPKAASGLLPGELENWRRPYASAAIYRLDALWRMQVHDHRGNRIPDRIHLSSVCQELNCIVVHWPDFLGHW